MTGPARMTPAKRGRPPTGHAATPTERGRRSIAKLKASGGRRLIVNLHAQAATDLAMIRTREEYPTDTMAVTAALSEFAHGGPPKK